MKSPSLGPIYWLLLIETIHNLAFIYFVISQFLGQRTCNNQLIQTNLPLNKNLCTNQHFKTLTWSYKLSNSKCEEEGIQNHGISGFKGISKNCQCPYPSTPSSSRLTQFGNIIGLVSNFIETHVFSLQVPQDTYSYISL